MSFGREPRMPNADEALPGRDEPVPVPETHFVNGAPLQGTFPGMERALFAMGCFWGAERQFWQAQGVHDAETILREIEPFLPAPSGVAADEGTDKIE